MATNHETAGSSPVSCANGDPSFTDRRIAAILHLWWKWHARSLEVAVPKGMRVRISPDAPKKIYGHVAQMAVGGTFRVFVVQVRILSWLPILMP